MGRPGLEQSSLMGCSTYILHHGSTRIIYASTIPSGCPLHAVNLCLLTSPLANHTGVRPASMRTIVCTLTVYVLLLPGLELTPAP